MCHCKNSLFFRETKQGTSLALLKWILILIVRCYSCILKTNQNINCWIFVTGTKASRRAQFAVPLCLPTNYKWNTQTGECMKIGEERSPTLYVIEDALKQLKTIKGKSLHFSYQESLTTSQIQPVTIYPGNILAMQVALASSEDDTDYFVFVCLVTWPTDASEVGGNLPLIQASLLFSLKGRLVSTRTTSCRQKIVRSFSKQGHLQHHRHSKVRLLRQLWSGILVSII